MTGDNPSERDRLRLALGPGADCMPVELLERCVDPQSLPLELAPHLESCAYCRAELDLLRSFLRAPSGDEEAAIRTITRRLQLVESRANAARDPWWKGLLQMRWLSPAAVALAAVLIVAGVGLQLRRGAAPQLNLPNQPETEVLRSGSISILAPAGDLAEVPARIQWQPIPGAQQYRIRLLEVDHSELWNTSTTQPEVDIPATVRSKIVPAKTLLVQVSAFDGADRKLAESDLVRFRILQKVYSH
jgi:hypothetical protein